MKEISKAEAVHMFKHSKAVVIAGVKGGPKFEMLRIVLNFIGETEHTEKYLQRLDYGQKMTVKQVTPSHIIWSDDSKFNIKDRATCYLIRNTIVWINVTGWHGEPWCMAVIYHLIND